MPSVPDETLASCWSVPSGFNDVVEERIAFVDVCPNHHHTFKHKKEPIVQGYRSEAIEVGTQLHDYTYFLKG